MVWIYGGGYVEGDKSVYDGAPLIQRSLKNGGEPIVYVALNYRVSFQPSPWKSCEKKKKKKFGCESRITDLFSIGWSVWLACRSNG
jgi:hypothetical protein